MAGVATISICAGEELAIPRVVEKNSRTNESVFAWFNLPGQLLCVG